MQELLCFIAGGFYYYTSCPVDRCPDALNFGRAWGLDAESPTYRRLRLIYLVSQTIFTVGYGDMTPVNAKERVWTVAMTVVGQTLYACSIANMCSIVVNMDATRTAYISHSSVVYQPISFLFAMYYHALYE